PLHRLANQRIAERVGHRSPSKKTVARLSGRRPRTRAGSHNRVPGLSRWCFPQKRKLQAGLSASNVPRRECAGGGGHEATGILRAPGVARVPMKGREAWGSKARFERRGSTSTSPRNGAALKIAGLRQFFRLLRPRRSAASCCYVENEPWASPIPRPPQALYKPHSTRRRRTTTERANSSSPASRTSTKPWW